MFSYERPGRAKIFFGDRSCKKFWWVLLMSTEVLHWDYHWSGHAWLQTGGVSFWSEITLGCSHWWIFTRPQTISMACWMSRLPSCDTTILILFYSRAFSVYECTKRRSLGGCATCCLLSQRYDGPRYDGPRYFVTSCIFIPFYWIVWLLKQSNPKI